MRTATFVAASAIVGFVFIASPSLPTRDPAPPPPDEVVAASMPADVAPALPTIGVRMGYCATPGCELSFQFDAPIPQPKVELDPPQAGKLAWRSPTELVFTPEKGALLAGHEVTVKIPELSFTEKLVVPFFTAAGKVAEWPIEPGKPRFVAFLNGFVQQLGRGPLFALYDQPVDAAVIARSLTVTAAGKRLGVRVVRPASSEQVYDAPIPLDHVVTIELDAMPPDGEVVSFSLPSRDDKGADVAFAKDLKVNTTLTSTGWADATASGRVRRAPLDASFTVPLSNSITAKQFGAHVHIEPAPKSMSTYVWGGSATVSARLLPGVLYTLTLDTGLHDVLGNALKAPVVGTFRAQDAVPALAVPSDDLVIEHGHAKLPVQVTNVGRATMTAQKFASAAAWMAARTSHAECSGDERAVDIEAPLNEAATREVALDPGLYCVAFSAKGRGSEAGTEPLVAHTYVQVSSLGVTAKVYEGGIFLWATKLSDASPLAGARLAITDETGKTLASGTAGTDGTATIATTLANRTGLASNGFVVVNDGELVVPLREDQLANPRQFGLDGRADADPLAAALFTERGVYRPGETVHLKALVRDPDTRRAATGKLEVTLVDPRGEQLDDSTLDLDAFGGAAYEHALPDGAKVGEYTLRIGHGGHTGVRTFRVEEYRVPTFAVAVDTDETWRTGAQVHAAIAATYMQGGTLAGRDVGWEVTRVPEPFAPAAWKGYVFDAGMGARDVESLTRGTARLDGQGRLVVPVKPEVGSGAGPMRYVVEASVTDVDRQSYAGRLSRVVHPADVYVGVAPPSRTVVAAGDTLTVPIVAVAPDGVAKAGIDVTATLERVDYHGAVRMAGAETQRVQRPVSTTVKTCSITTKATAVECKLAIPAAGEYVVRARGADGKRRPVEAAYRISASGGNTVAWPRFDSERITVIADKPSYKVGDVAKLVVQSPFGKARGLLAIERNGVVEHRLFAIDNDTPEITVPITEAHVPNIYASIVVLRGRIHDAVDATGFPTGAPAFRMGYVQLRVEPTLQKLSVEVTPQAPKASPGETFALDLAVKDASGAPRAGQATVMVVDEAVLGLTRFKTPDPIAEIFAPRPLAVRTAESRLDLLASRRSRREQVFPGGDGGERGAGEELPKELEKLPNDMRKLFKSTAYYNVAVPVGADGRAHVSFALPDNVTTYRIMAVVVDNDTRAGAGQSSVVSRKPLIVQPVLPRFVRPGDHLRVEARAFNGTEMKGSVELAASFSGVALEGSAPAKASADATAGGEARFAFPIVVPDDARGTVAIRFAGKLGSSSDAVEIKLPVVDAGTSRKLVAQKLVTGTDKIELPLPPAAERRAGTLSIELLASTTALSQLKDAVGYLMAYPNGCIEQTTSTAYPLVVLKELLPEMGITVDQTKLREFAEAGVKRILSFQTKAGGLSYWPGGTEPHAFATAFGLTALIEAKHRGFTVPDDALAKMADYLESALRAGAITGEMPHGSMADADTRALFVMTLGRLGRPQASYVSTLWAQRDKLTPFGMSFLGVAVAEGAGDKSLLPAILAAIRGAATEEPVQMHYDGAKPASGYSMGSSLRTHAGALLAYTEPTADHDVAGKLLAGLLARQRYGMWGNTQENVFGIMAVAQLVGAGGDDAAFTVKVNGVPVDASRIHPTGKRGKRLELAEKDLPAGAKAITLEIATTGKPVFATLRAEYTAILDDKSRLPHTAGFAVSRRYEALDGTPLDKKIKLGSLVRVRVRVDAATANHYVAIDDKLPAGLEPLNAALATTATVDAGTVTPAMKKAFDRMSYSELRDARVAFYIDEMPAGSYDFVYVARATTPGTFARPAAAAEAMYATDVTGTSSIDDIVVE